MTPPGTSPDPIDDTPGRFLHDPAITWAIDKSQVRTRVYGKGASTQIATTIAAAHGSRAGARTARCSTRPGGQAIAGVTPDGAACRVLTYTGVQLGGGGGLVGPGAAPSAAPGLALADGAGIESGVHQYAITFVTAAGESLPGPVGAITVGPIAAAGRGADARGAVHGGRRRRCGHALLRGDVRHGERGNHDAGRAQVVDDDDSAPACRRRAPRPAALLRAAGNLAVGVGYAVRHDDHDGGRRNAPRRGGESGDAGAPAPRAAPGAPRHDRAGRRRDLDSRRHLSVAYLAGSYETALSSPRTVSRRIRVP